MGCLWERVGRDATLVIAFVISAAVPASVTAQPQWLATVPSAQLRARVGDLTPQTDPAQIRAAAQALFDEHRQSRFPAVRTAACAPAAPRTGDTCLVLLRAIARDTAQAWADRVRAAVWLPADAADTAPLLDGLLSPATADQLGQVAEALAELPEYLAVPQLVRVLDSGPESARLEAARLLPRFQTSIGALFQVRDTSQPGSPLWLAATLGVARLGAAEVRQQLSVLSPYYGTDGYAEVGAVLFEAGDPQGEPMLRRAAATASPAAAARAAFLLRDLSPEVFTSALDRAMKGSPAERIAALQLATKAQVPLSINVIPWLVDPDEGVRVATALYLLAVPKPAGPAGL